VLKGTDRLDENEKRFNVGDPDWQMIDIGNARADVDLVRRCVALRSRSLSGSDPIAGNFILGPESAKHFGLSRFDLSC